MKILDPMEVARVEVWPFWELEDKPEREQTRVLRAAEFTVFEDLTRRAKVGRLLNEKIPASAERVRMPASYSASIIPDEIRERLGHSDERIARRAATIAALAQVVRERDVSLGLRETLVAQAERLRYLASRRLEEVRGDTPNPKTETRLNPGED